DERYGTDLGLPAPLDSLNRLVRRVMNVGGSGVELELRLLGDAREIVRFHRRSDLHRADLLRFLHRLPAPGTGEDVIGLAAREKQVHRHHRELKRCAALEKEHLIAGGDRGELADVGLAALDDIFERLRAVADLENRHPNAGKGHQVLLRLSEDRLRKNGGAGGKVENAVSHDASLYKGSSVSSRMSLLERRIESSTCGEGSDPRWMRATAALAPSKTMFSVSCT